MVISKTPVAKLISSKDYLDSLEPRKKKSHKGDYGHVLVIGGDQGMSGAPKIAAVGALRTGSGLVTIASHPDHAVLLNLTQPEIMCHAISKPKQLAPLLDKATVLVLGPGLGCSRWSKQLFKQAIRSDLPMVVDADGLNWLAQFSMQSDHWILTPHPGEAARLLKTTVQGVQQNRLDAARAIQKKFGGVVILKGAGTIIATGAEELLVCEAGNPGMASAGMGDLLSGVIGGLLAQHLPLDVAAPLAVCLHAEAADQEAKARGVRGLLATDLIPLLRARLNAYDVRQ